MIKLNLFLGDCLKILKTIPNASVDLVLSDLPYEVTECDWDSLVDLDLLWPELLRVAKHNAAFVFTAVQPFTSMLVMSQPKLFRYDWVWEKGNATGFFNAKLMPLRAHESVLVFYRKLPTFNPQKTTGHPRRTAKRKSINSECYGKGVQVTEYNSTERYPRSVQFFSSDKQKANLHPTQKPVALMQYLIRSYSDAGETVLDVTMGSGTTGVAAIQEKRNFIGIEKNLKHYNTAAERLGIYEDSTDQVEIFTFGQIAK